jgi:prepilin peptidase CpaA
MADQHQHVALLAACAVGAVGAVLDWRKGQIPNWLTLPSILLAPLLHAFLSLVAREKTEAALYEGGYALGGAALCSVVPLLLFRQGAIGGGDLKLLAAVGALLQPVLGVEAQMYGFFAAAVLAPASLAFEGKLLVTIKNALAIGANLFLPKTQQRSVDSSALSWFRLGPAIFIGVLLTTVLHW